MRVTAGAAFTATEDGAFAVRPNSPGGLHHARAGRACGPATGLYLWTLDDPPPEAADPAGWLIAERSYFGPLWLAKALGQTGLGRRDLLVAHGWGVQRDRHGRGRPGAGHRVRAVQDRPAGTAGRDLPACGRVAGRTTPHEARRDRRAAARRAGRRSQASSSWPGAGTAAGWPVSTPLPASDGGVDRLRERGVYLITGGLGGIGLAIARGLARDVSARLVLLGQVPSAARGRRGLSCRGATRPPRPRCAAASRPCATWRQPGRRCWSSPRTCPTRRPCARRCVPRWTGSAPCTGSCTPRVCRAWACCSSRNPTTRPSRCGPKVTGTRVCFRHCPR